VKVNKFKYIQVHIYFISSDKEAVYLNVSKSTKVQGQDV
jgi:hypothetical protein